MPVYSDNNQGPARVGARAGVKWGLKIPMRDGARLNAMVFRPLRQTGPAPVVFEMTPYGIDAFYSGALAFAENGLTFVLIDSRGRGDSDGEFDMFEVDIADTVDAIEWLSGQEWSDGQIAMYGGSYSGANQWTATKSNHPALKTITPWGAGCPGIDLNGGGIPLVGHISWHLLTSGKDTYWQMSADSGHWAEMLAESYRQNWPATDLPKRAGISRPKFEQSLRDPHYALRSMSFIPTEEEIREIDMPILSSTGHYDSTHPGTLFHFERFEQFANESARKKHYLVIGPWNHAGMNGADNVGALAFGPAAKVDMAKVRYDWFKWVFGSGEKPSFLKHRIMYYMAGAEEWRGCDTLEEAFSTRKHFFMSSDGSANDPFHSGRLQSEQNSTKPDRYVADPFDHDIIKMELMTRPIDRPTSGKSSVLFPDPVRGLHFQIAGEDPTEQAYAYNLGRQGVIYHSMPLAQSFEIAGKPELSLWLTIDAPDTDVVALLYEILPDDASSILLWSDLLRLRYRNSRLEPELVTPGEPFEFTFCTPKFMSRRLRKGSRLRLVVRSPASIYYEKNLNLPEIPCEQSADDARKCTVLVHHEPGRQSLLTLPISTHKQA